MRERERENALAVVEYLADNPHVAWVNYPGLESHETHERGSGYLEGGYGGMIRFGLEGGYEVARGTVESTPREFACERGETAKTLIIHPASTPHQQLTEEEQLSAGMIPEMVRISVGIEDLLVDLDTAIRDASG
jgi:O-acetylhomoserine (thiol)-lyase